MWQEWKKDVSQIPVSQDRTQRSWETKTKMERPFAPSRSRGSGLINHDHDVYDYYDDFDEIFCDLFITKCSVRSLSLQRSATLDMMPLLWCCLFNEHVYILAKRG